MKIYIDLDSKESKSVSEYAKEHDMSVEEMMRQIFFGAKEENDIIRYDDAIIKVWN